MSKFLDILEIRCVYKALEMLVKEYYFKHMEHNVQMCDMALLGSDMAVDEQNHTSDPAIWYEWLDATGGREITIEYLTVEEGYNAAIKFLTNYAERLESKDIKDFIAQLTLDKWIKWVVDILEEEARKAGKL
ncbi:hypothetical protein MIDIC_150001 [Alphaproteobacteria bacterium]